MTTYSFWQAPDRDSPAFPVAEGEEAIVGPQLWALLQMDTLDGHDDDEVTEASGIEVSRPRRWHKIFERMGLMFREDGRTFLTPVGNSVRALAERSVRESRLQMAKLGLMIAIRFQLKNPADESSNVAYPDDCDVHPYWAILRAADALDGKLHWDELNRELMRVMTDADLDGVIARIRDGRSDTDYSPQDGGSARVRLRDRCYEAGPTTEDRDGEGQVRDQKTTPWFRRAGFGGLLLENPGSQGEGYWTIPPDLRSMVREMIANPPPFRAFETTAEWFAFLGAASDRSSLPAARDDIGRNVILFGPPGTGKSYRVRQELSGFAQFIRCSFHPEYSYADFIGTYKPVVGWDPTETILSHDGGASIQRPVVYYAFEPGPLVRAIELASRRGADAIALIVEEINRGDCAAIFGDFFQLLDRNGAGESEYPLHPPLAVAQYLVSRGTLTSVDDVIVIPRNLSLLATMNTSDQSLYPMDSAFKRRWDWMSMPISYDEPLLIGIALTGATGEATVLWLDLIRRINDAIVGAGLSGDKRVGPWYIKVEGGAIPASAIRDKLLFYLWHDVFRDRPSLAFAASTRTFDQAQEVFDSGGVREALSPLFPEPVLG